jgi:glutaredoxin
MRQRGWQMQIEIVTSEWCDYCSAAKELLRENGFQYIELELENSLDIMSKYNLRTVPQIFVNGKLLEGGYTGLKESISVLSKGEINE